LATKLCAGDKILLVDTVRDCTHPCKNLCSRARPHQSIPDTTVKTNPISDICKAWCGQGDVMVYNAGASTRTAAAPVYGFENARSAHHPKNLQSDSSKAM
jgi:hypothetical protein